MKTKKKYVVVFDNNTSSDAPGDNLFANKRKAIEYAKYLVKNRLSYTDDYIGGSCNVFVQAPGDPADGDFVFGLSIERGKK